MGRVLRLQGRAIATVTLFVDTSVWSLAFRRDADAGAPEVRVLRRALERADAVVTTGLVLQELLQGFAGPRARKDIVERFTALPLLMPDRQDHIDAAELRNRCRRAGVQLAAIDALLAQLCIRHKLTLLTTDNDFLRAAAHSKLRVWKRIDRRSGGGNGRQGRNRDGGRQRDRRRTQARGRRHALSVGSRSK